MDKSWVQSQIAFVSHSVHYIIHYVQPHTSFSTLLSVHSHPPSESTFRITSQYTYFQFNICSFISLDFLRLFLCIFDFFLLLVFIFIFMSFFWVRAGLAVVAFSCYMSLASPRLKCSLLWQCENVNSHSTFSLFTNTCTRNIKTHKQR